MHNCQNDEPGHHAGLLTAPVHVAGHRRPGSACFFKLQQSTDYAIGGIATITRSRCECGWCRDSASAQQRQHDATGRNRGTGFRIEKKSDFLGQAGIADGERREWVSVRNRNQ